MVGKILVGLVAVQHLFIMIMEMFLWEKRGPSIFKAFDKALFTKTTAIAKNMGLYNGFIAGGLIWSLFISDPVWSRNIAMYFLACVAIAGVYASFTAEKSIFVKQSVLAILGLIFLII